MSREVLLIEDDELYRESIRFMFQGEPYQFVEAGSPDAGIAALKRHPQIRVVLLDLEFVHGTARTFLDYVEKRAGDYRVIVLTGHDELLAAEQAEDYKAVFNYLPKAGSSSTQHIRFSVKQAFKDLERAALAREVDFLLEVQTKVNANRDTAETLDEISEFLCSIVGAYTCHIRVYDDLHGDYRLGGFAGDEKGTRRFFELPRTKGELFSGKVVETGIAIHYDDLQNMEEFQRFKATALVDSVASAEEELYWQRVRSAYIVPISTGLYGKQVDAVLNVSSETVAFFDKDKRNRIDEYQNLAGLTIAKDWLHRKRDSIHHDYSQISKMLGEMTDHLKGNSVLRGIYEVVTRKISKIINAEVVTIFLYNRTTRMVENVAELRGDEFLATPTERYHPGQSLTGWVYEKEKPIHIPRPAEDVHVKPRDDSRFDSANEEEYLQEVPSRKIEHYLGVPIMMGGKTRGVLRAINKKSAYYEESGIESPHCLLERGFSRDCRNAMHITASHLAVAIRNAELLREKDHQVMYLRLITEVGGVVNSTLDLNEVLRRTMEVVAEVGRAEICMLFLDDGNDQVVLKGCFGMPLIPNAFYKLGEGVTGNVAKTGKPWLMKSTNDEDGKYDDFIRDHLTATYGAPRHIKSLMVVPIRSKDRPLGVMKVINRIGDRLHFDDEDLELFQMFASYVGGALENAQIYKVASDRLAIADRNAALSSMVTAVGHEINNTFGLIPANVRGIRARIGTFDKEIDTMLATILDAANQATEFANEIAGFSAKWMGEKEPLDLNHVIEDAVNLDKYKAWANVRLQLTPCGEPLVCEIYRTPFIQIVRNIVINAFQALESRSEGVIQISTFKRPGESGKVIAAIEIEDNGPGIEPSHIGRIFDVDFTTKPKGNGVGLWLARTQLELIGGEIDVKSKLGHGAKFILHIPVA